MIKTHRDSPVAHAALRISLRDFGESFRGFFVPKGMQEGDRAIELLLRRTIARDGKVDAAEFFSHLMFVLIHLLRSQRKGKKKHSQGRKEKQSTEFHNNLHRKGHYECPNRLLKTRNIDQESIRSTKSHQGTRIIKQKNERCAYVFVLVRVISWIVITLSEAC
jgi:hypothetical protein